VVLGEKPAGPSVRFVLIGHLHISVYFRQGPLCMFQVCCWESPNSLVKRIGGTPVIGGWVLEADLTEGGLVHKLTPREITYAPIEDDYKHHYIPLAAKRETVRVEPIFRLEENDG